MAKELHVLNVSKYLVECQQGYLALKCAAAARIEMSSIKNFENAL